MSEDSNTATSVATPIVTNSEPPKDTPIPSEPETPKPEESVTIQQNDYETENNEEESLTPPLLPNMKIKLATEAEATDDNKKVEKEIKQRNADWDMFADEHCFKSEHNVSL